MVPPFCAARTDEGFVYVWYFTVDEEELYDLNGAIPGIRRTRSSSKNRAGRAAYQDVVSLLHAWVVQACSPLPPVSD